MTYVVKISDTRGLQSRVFTFFITLKQSYGEIGVMIETLVLLLIIPGALVVYHLRTYARRGKRWGRL